MVSWTIKLDHIVSWLQQLPEEQYRDTIVALNYLAEVGPSGGRPYIDRVHHSKYHNLKNCGPENPPKISASSSSSTSYNKQSSL